MAEAVRAAAVQRCLQGTGHIYTAEVAGHVRAALERMSRQIEVLDLTPYIEGSSDE